MQMINRWQSKLCLFVFALLGIFLFGLWVSWAATASADEFAPIADGGVTGLGVEVSPNYTVSAQAGDHLIFDHTIENLSGSQDTFLLFTTSEQGWRAELVRGDVETETLTIELLPDTLASFQVSVTVPASEWSATENTVVFAISETDPLISDSAIDTIVVSTQLFFPILLKEYPPVPATPVLNAIDNPDQDGNYTVSWQAAERADSYSLEEDDNSSFSSPTVVYSGTGTSWTVPAPGKSAGTYYYRVIAGNEYGNSLYSQTQSTTVFTGSFTVDASAIPAGSCTTLRWNFSNIQAIYINFAYGFDKKGVSGVGSSTICPSIDTTYEALIIKTDGSQQTYQAAVDVTGTTCGDPYVQRFDSTTYDVNPNEKFTIFWNVSCAKAVFLQIGTGPEQGVTGNSSREVTLTQTSLIKLRVEYNNRTLSDNASFTVVVTP